MCPDAPAVRADALLEPCARHAPPPPPCDILSGGNFFVGPWTVLHCSLRVLRWVAVF